MHALIVDDSRTMRLVIRRVLEGLGLTVAEAGNGREALDLLEGGLAPDVALVDWNMPVMNGVEFVQALRLDERFDRTRVMMVTSETEADQVARALAAGADEYVMKPFTPDVIREKLTVLALLEA